jgi:hypothetical protein
VTKGEKFGEGGGRGAGEVTHALRANASVEVNGIGVEKELGEEANVLKKSMSPYLCAAKSLYTDFFKNF